MSENLKRCLKVSVILVIAFELIDIFVPTPVIEFLAYTIVTLCCIGFVILFFVILYGISKSEIWRGRKDKNRILPLNNISEIKIAYTHGENKPKGGVFMLKAITTYLKRVVILSIVISVVCPALYYLVPHAILEFLGYAFCYLMLAGGIFLVILWFYLSFKSLIWRCRCICSWPGNKTEMINDTRNQSFRRNSYCLNVRWTAYNE